MLFQGKTDDLHKISLKLYNKDKIDSLAGVVRFVYFPILK
jgi:hypothetical protein